jgi:hypothetical protein
VKNRWSICIPDCSYSFDFHDAKLLIFFDISKFFGHFFRKNNKKNAKKRELFLLPAARNQGGNLIEEPFIIR